MTMRTLPPAGSAAVGKALHSATIVSRHDPLPSRALVPIERPRDHPAFERLAAALEPRPARGSLIDILA